MNTAGTEVDLQPADHHITNQTSLLFLTVHVYVTQLHYFNEKLLFFVLLSEKQVQVSYSGLSEVGFNTSLETGRDTYL